MHAQTSVSKIPSGANVALGASQTMPTGLCAALAERFKEDPDFRLTIHFMHASEAIRPLLDIDPDRCRLLSYFNSGIERAAGDRIEFVPGRYSDVANNMLRNGVTHLLVSMSENNGWLSFGTCYGYSAQLARTWYVTLHAEINRLLPFTATIYGAERYGALLSYHDTPMKLAPPHKNASKVSQAIADNIIKLLPDAPTVQVGVGAVPDIVLQRMLAERIKVSEFWSELLCPGMLDMVDAGLVSNGITFTIALGSDDSFYQRMNDNPRIRGCGVNETNNVQTIASKNRMVSINAAMEVDLLGQVNSEQRCGKQYSGTGGQLDFVLGASKSNEGISIISLPSTYMDRFGRLQSRIVPTLSGSVTVPRNCVHTIVTEYGSACLVGKSEKERRELLIGIAHPSLRETLRKG